MEETGRTEEQTSFLKDAKDGAGEKADTDNTPTVPTARWYKRLQLDEVFRLRFVHTAVLCWALVTLGWAMGMTGPTFPDIRLILNKDLDTASWYFTTGGLGYLVGSFASGALYDRYNKLVLLTITCVGLAVTSAAQPWCSMFALMLVVRFLSGVFAGGLDAGGNADIIHVWGAESGPYMQAFHFAFSIGGILGPLASEPFLVEKSCRPGNTTGVKEDSDNSDAFPTIYPLYNSSEMVEGNITGCEMVYGKTNVHFAFLLLGCLFLSSAILFFLLYIWTKNKAPYVAGSKENKSDSNSPDKRKLTMKEKAMFITLLACLITSYCMYEDTLFSFLMTFCVSHMNWKKATGSYLTAFGWFSFAGGRLLGIVVVHYVDHGLLLLLSLSVAFGSFGGLLIASMLRLEILIWVFVATAGLFMSVVFPCVMSWTTENILTVSGKISAIFLTSAACGGMAFPLLVGYLMDNVSTIWFNIFLLIMSGIALFIFFTLVCLKKVVRSRAVGAKEDGRQMKELKSTENNS